MTKQQVCRDLKRLGLSGQRHGVSFTELGAANIRRMREQAQTELRVYCRKRGLMTAMEAIRFVWYGETVKNLKRRAPDFPRPVESRRFGMWTWDLYREADVKRYCRQRLTHGGDQMRRYFDPAFVKRWARKSGRTQSQAEKLAARAQQRSQRYKRLRAGLRHAQDRHQRWLERWEQLRCETPDDDPVMLVTLVALEDWQTHLDDWPRERYPASKSDPLDFANGRVRKAAYDRVRKALQNTGKNS